MASRASCAPCSAVPRPPAIDVLTTHYLEEAQELCKEIAIINHGEVVACEPTEKLISSLDRKTLMVTPNEDVPAKPDLGPLAVDLKADGRLAINYQPSATKVAEILDRLNAAGVSVKDITTVEADLEDVFLELTAEKFIGLLERYTEDDVTHHLILITLDCSKASRANRKVKKEEKEAYYAAAVAKVRELVSAAEERYGKEKILLFWAV